MSIKPKIEPMTMPAICPPESPPPLLDAAGVVDGRLVLVGDEMFEVDKGGSRDVNAGSRTFSHRPVALEFKQQESVAFGELAAQNPHSPCRFGPKPQSFGSLSSP